MATEIIKRVGIDMCAPYGVYVNGEQVGIYDDEEKARKHYDQICCTAMTPQQRQRERDKLRTVLQRPIASPRYRVVYLKNGKEHRSAWLYREKHAQQGLAMMREKYGIKNAIIYVD